MTIAKIGKEESSKVEDKDQDIYSESKRKHLLKSYQALTLRGGGKVQGALATKSG